MALGDPQGVDLNQLDPDEQIRRNLIARPNLSPGLNLPGIGPSAPPASPSSLTGAVPPAHTGPVETSGLGKMGAMPDPPAPAIARPTARMEDEYRWNQLKSGPSSGIAGLQPKSTLGKIGKDVLRIGDVVGSVAAPGLMAQIPGTSMHHALLEQRAGNRLGQDIGQEQKEAQAARDIAEAHKAQSEADAPVAPGTPEQQVLHDLMTGDNGSPRINPDTQKPYSYLEAYRAAQKPLAPKNPEIRDTSQGIFSIGPDGTPKPVMYGGQQLTPKAAAGNFEEQAYQEWHATHPDGTREEFARQHATDVRAPREGSWIPLEDGQGNPVLYNPVTRQTQALPDGFKAKGAGHVDAATKEKILTYWQPALDSAERFNVMARNYQDALKGHDQQAMLSLLANHLGMTMGLQKGSRLTRDIIHEAEQSRPWLQGLEAKFDKNGYLTGVVLTPQQMGQMMTLAEGRYSQDVAKSRSMAGYVGVTDEPERKLGREGATYYLSISNGDKQKARDAARADGWQF